MRPRFLLLGACAIGAYYLYRTARDRTYLRGYGDGLDQRDFDAAMDAANPDTGWADLYDVPLGSEGDL